MHQRDLRIQDNESLAEAADKSDDILPVFILDFQRPISERRKSFVYESAESLKKAYKDHGSDLLITQKTLDEITTNRGIENVYSKKDPRTPEIGERLGSPYLQTTRNRQSWDANAEKYLESETVRPKSFEPFSNTSTNSTSPDIKNKSAQRQRGGRKEAENQLEEFKRKKPNYSSSISKPIKAEANATRMSPYVAYGVVSVREVYQSARNLAETDKEMIQNRLFWNLHMRQKLKDNNEIPEKSINPVFTGLHRSRTETKLLEAWKNGETGFPMVDASMRALKQTGYLNFRMRAMCASFYVHIMRQWWKPAADHMYKQLLDSDPAINYYQWQMQGNLTGIHPLRIYDPVKQQKEVDPSGKYISKYIPELSGLEKHIGDPWNATDQELQEAGVKLGENYPRRKIRFNRMRNKTQAQFKKLAPRAKEAYNDDEIWQKASLSKKHSREQIVNEPQAKETDTSLKEWED